MALLKNQTAPQLVKKQSEFYVMHPFVTVFKTARHLSVFWVKWIYSDLRDSHANSNFQFNITLPSMPRSSKRFISFSLPTKALNVIPIVPYTASRATHLILFHFWPE